MTTQADKEKDGVSIEFIPVNDYGTAPRTSPAQILAALGYQGKLPDAPAEEPRWEGYVPPSNRDGKTSLDDKILGRHKADVVSVLDASVADHIGNLTLDPRDNPRAKDDTWDGTPSPVAYADDKERQKAEKDSKDQDNSKLTVATTVK